MQVAGQEEAQLWQQHELFQLTITIEPLLVATVYINLTIASSIQSTNHNETLNLTAFSTADFNQSLQAISHCS